MKRFTLIALGLMILAATFATEKPALARLHYDGGGDWYNDPDMLTNLAEYANKNIGTDFATDQAVVKPDDPKLFDYPFIFMTGHGNVAFSDKDIDNLRKYLERGGFLYADDDYGMDESFRREMQRLLPNMDMVELPAGHEIFHCCFDFPKGLPKTHEHDDRRPQAFGIFDSTGRMLVLYTFESNISDGWASPQVHNDPPEVREKALQMGVNILYYLLAS